MEAIAHVPNLEEINSIKTGSIVLDCFGRWAQVVEVTYRGTDVNGKAYVGFYVEFGDKSTVSGSYKEDELVITVANSRIRNSAELQKIGREMVESGNRTIELEGRNG